MASEISSIVVCDAGPLIHLDELKCLDLLRDFREILVPEAVWLEVQHHRSSALRRRKLPLIRVDFVSEPTSELALLLKTIPLDLGEEEALRLMENIENAILLADDAAARLVAERMEFSVHGTLGMLLLGWQRRRRSKRQILNILRNIPQRTTLHASKKLVIGLIAQVQEERL